MNDCERFQEMISALIDGELSAEEEAEVRAHMADCPDCSAMYEAFAAVGAAVRAQEVPDTLHEGIMAQVRAAEKANRTQHTIIRLRPILAAAACLIVVVGTVFALRSNSGFGRKAMDSSNAEMAMAPEMQAVYSVGGTSAGSSEAAPDMAAAEDAGIFESKVASVAVPTSDAPAVNAVNEPEMPKAAQDMIKDSANREAIGPMLTMRLAAVTEDGLTGTVADAGDQALAAIDEEITVQWDGDTDGFEPDMLLSVTLDPQRLEEGSFCAVSVVPATE